MGPIGSPETSTSNHLNPRNNSEDRRIHETDFESCPVVDFGVSGDDLSGSVLPETWL
jgi:hypothetical protein